MKYNIFPYYKYTIITDKTINEVIRNLKDITIENRQMELLHDEKKVFTGSFKNDSIILNPLTRLNNGIKNSFAPRIQIKTSINNQGKTVLDIKIKETFLTWLVFIIVLLCFASLVIQGSRLWWYSIWFILCIGVFEISFWIPCKNTIRVLEGALTEIDK